MKKLNTKYGVKSKTRTLAKKNKASENQINRAKAYTRGWFENNGSRIYSVDAKQERLHFELKRVLAHDRKMKKRK